MATKSMLESTVEAVPAPRRDLAPLLRRAARLARTPWALAAAVLALTAVSALIRVQSLDFRYWIDEGISVGIASHPLSQLPHLLREDGSPPLYYVLLHVWMQLFGRGEVVTHVLSLIFALVAVPVSYWAGASLFGRRVGLTAALLLATVPFLTTYAQETRMYSLMVLLSLACSAAFAHVFVRRSRRHLPLFVLSLAGALYTHNWGLFLAVSAFVVWIALVRGAAPERRRGLIRDGALGFGAVAVLYAPWLPTLLYQASHTGAPWALKPDVWSLTQGLYFIVGGRGAAVALLLGAGAGLIAVHRTGGLRAAGLVLLALGLLTLLLAWFEAKLNPSWAPRYEAAIVGPLALAVALGLVRADRLGAFALALVVCFWVLDPVPSSIYSKSNVAAAAHAVEGRLGTHPLVLSTQPEQVPTLAYYLPGVRRFGTPLGPVPDAGVVDWRNALERFDRSSVQGTLVPMLSSLHHGDRVALVIPTRLPHEPRYLMLVDRASRVWRRFLDRDPWLAPVMQTSSHAGASGLPVEILVYRRR